MFCTRRIVAAIALLILLLPISARAQFKAEESKGGDKGPKLQAPVIKKYKCGLRITATTGPLANVMATIPVPMDWPEQQVQVLEEDISPTVGRVDYRPLGKGVRQMVIEIPQLPAGQEAHAIVTFEVTKHTLSPPEETTGFEIPKKLARDLLIYVGPSPFIESRHPKIISLAKELVADKENDWAKVESIYDWVRENVKYENGELKGAIRALNDKTGDCEELTSLFIALCRTLKIPARTVWVPGHCYPEFYLTDAEGNGYWFPCQAAGSRAFGGIPEERPILQKGDNFRDPDRSKERFRYVSENLKASAKGGQPKVKFIREEVAN